ncbi:MAG: FxsA family protein [Acidiferrobacterales bacterium]
MPILFLSFLLIPVIEIWLLIEIGGVIGVGWTLVTIVATALAGAWLVRSQGLAIFGRIQREMAEGRIPTGDMLQGLMLLVAGAVLLTPGFFTDTVGFALLIPVVRRRLSRWVMTKAAVRVHTRHTAANGQVDAIDGSFRREND